MTLQDFDENEVILHPQTIIIQNTWAVFLELLLLEIA